jgi:beta-barrel assembly-enhancing protease
MTTKIRFTAVFSLLITGVILAAIKSTEGRVNLSSILSLWSDTARDTDQIGMRLTRLSDAEEMRIGADLVPSMLTGLHEIPADSAYITEVAQSVLPYVQRHGIHYHFRVIQSDQINAFAIPGGEVFVTSGLLGFVESEAALAAILGHEISHVDLRHCVERYQYEYRLKKAGAPEIGWMVEMAHRLATMGFASYQESEADDRGQRLAIEATYDPNAAATLFNRMREYFREPSPPRATTPDQELQQAADDAIGSYFRTHPPSAERARQMNEAVARLNLKGRSFYVGRENVRRRVARSRRQFPGEERNL